MCLYADLNCVKLRQRRSESKSDQELLQDAMSQLAPGYLRSLVVSHCASLEMPVDIKRFNRLHTIEVYNSIIHSWPRESALTLTDHPVLRRVGLIRVNATGVPDGLLHSIQAHVANVVATNLTELPQALLSAWWNVKYLNVEHNSAMMGFPSVLAEMHQLERLALTNNHFTEIPKLSAGFRILIVARNPLYALPAIEDMSKLVVLGMEDTLIERLPAWSSAQLKDFRKRGLRAYGYGSPYCDQLSAREAEASIVDCSAPGPYIDGFLPLADMSRILSL